MLRKAMLLAAAAVVVAVGAETVGAASFRIEPGGAMRMTSIGKATIEDGSISIACDVTLAGTVTTALLNKVQGAAVGTTTDFRTANCVGGNVPGGVVSWPQTYESILGVLPEQIPGWDFRLARVDIRASTFGEFIRCRYRGDVPFLLAVTGRNPYTSGNARLLANALALQEGSLCPSPITIDGSFFVSPTQRITRL